MSASFVVPLAAEESPSAAVEADGNPPDLQNAFRAFRKRRLEEKRAARAQEERRHLEERPREQVEALRRAFVDRAMQYCGVPYSRRYHQTPESEHYNAPLYLDCCGLVRKAVRDLRSDFGFDIGRWNQAYQFDTLPIELTEAEMQPGDLVFISGTYFNTKSKAQKHDMVHVEIWLGDGEKTLGARHQRGVVQVHDSYRFVSKTYHSMEYHFRSLEPWLQGKCVSHCEEHPWHTPTGISGGKYSLFDIENDEGDEGAGDDDDVLEAQTPADIAPGAAAHGNA